jgi:hypothetical protein
LNECFCKFQNSQHRELGTHQIDLAAEDCASRALNESELDDKDEEVLEEEKSQPGNEETKDKQKKSNAKLEEDLKKKSNSKDNSESMRATMSDYALQRERNIAENKILLASIKDAEFYAAMDELKKRPAPVKKKSEKVKPNAEERRTSARLAAVDTRWVSRFDDLNTPT